LLQKTVIARNLLILDQLREIDEALENKNIKLILLKGAALIELAPDYAAQRIMDDIDILVRPEYREKLRHVLLSLGYEPARYDPNALFHPGREVPVDLSSDIFYMDETQFGHFWDNAKTFRSSFKNIFIPELAELLVYIFVHCAVHHAERTELWEKDFALARGPLSGRIDWDDFHKKVDDYGMKEAWDIFCGGRPSTLRGMFYNLLLTSSIQSKGFIAIFLYSAPHKRRAFVLNELFPSAGFLKDRYGLKNRVEIFVFRIFRPVIIFWELAIFFSRFLRRLLP
jgi:hypothetical protein